MTDSQIPNLVQHTSMRYDWDARQLDNLDLPLTEMPIVQLDWHFRYPFWHSEGGYFDLTPARVLDYPDWYAQHHEKIMKADLRWPLDVIWHKDRWVILDGLYRLVKATMLGRTVVQVRKIPSKYLTLAQKSF